MKTLLFKTAFYAVRLLRFLILGVITFIVFLHYLLEELENQITLKL